MDTAFTQWKNEILSSSVIQPDEIPRIDLYMDQVTTFLEDQLRDTKRAPEDKIMTKTMINNYSKEKLLPPPRKKKYTKQHLLLLSLIYQCKPILSITDIYTLLAPFIDDEAALGGFYNSYLAEDQAQREALAAALENDPQADPRILAASLIARAALEKRIAEKILDHLNSEDASEEKEKQKE